MTGIPWFRVDLADFTRGDPPAVSVTARNVKIKLVVRGLRYRQVCPRPALGASRVMRRAVVPEQSMRRSPREVGYVPRIVALIDSAEVRIDNCLDHRHGHLSPCRVYGRSAQAEPDRKAGLAPRCSWSPARGDFPGTRCRVHGWRTRLGSMTQAPRPGVRHRARPSRGRTAARPHLPGADRRTPGRAADRRHRLDGRRDTTGAYLITLHSTYGQGGRASYAPTISYPDGPWGWEGDMP